MNQPRLFFQGFDGARKVQSMMIDFPELQFVLLDGRRTHPIRHINIEDFAGKYRAVVRTKARYDMLPRNFIEVNIFSDNVVSKIAVAPESEGFFVIDGYKDFRDEYYRNMNGDIFFWQRNGKRIWMPQTL